MGTCISLWICLAMFGFAFSPQPPAWQAKYIYIYIYIYIWAPSSYQCVRSLIQSAFRPNTCPTNRFVSMKKLFFWGGPPPIQSGGDYIYIYIYIYIWESLRLHFGTLSDHFGDPGVHGDSQQAPGGPGVNFYRIYVAYSKQLPITNCWLANS